MEDVALGGLAMFHDVDKVGHHLLGAFDGEGGNEHHTAAGGDARAIRLPAVRGASTERSNRSRAP